MPERKYDKIQLEFLVAIRIGLGRFLSENTRLLTSELVGVFLLESECMCLVCLNFDCANNTCSWVGCDACLHC
ncbi:hypothetical protein H5410_037400 [Solanum commersonii]|uniref:Uncharacterized protein n=1 Tax=Solanum commersonii TaxID=4109 RepID=A0A9J5Y9F5_SOLCO|nr:hypothetical protein H5410_037400 [Solanum commersonii]